MTIAPIPPTRARRATLGELRPSQILFTFGVGAIVDLPNVSAMVMGLDDWDETHMRSIEEPRLLEAVRRVCGAQVRELKLPPAPETPSTMPRPGSDESLIGVPVAVFPRWLFCTRCRQLAGVASGLFRLDVDRYRSDRTRYIHDNCRAGTRSEVLPARFLVTCEKGHLDDFPWIRFVHKGETTCTANLELRPSYGSGEAASLVVTCRTCEKSRVMSEAFDDDAAFGLGGCTGRRPQLRDHDSQPCETAPRAISMGASNLWFPVPLSALAIPRDSDELANAVSEQWAVLGGIPSSEHIHTLRTARVLGGLTRWSDEEIWQVILARRTQPPEAAPSDLRVPEWEAFTRTRPASQSEDFKLREVEPPPEYAALVRRVVLVERLREVRAIAGFTRIAPPGDVADSASEATTLLAPMTRRPPTWVPACDVRGEGVFLELNEDRLREWLKTAVALQRDRKLFDAHRADRVRHQRTPKDKGYPGMRYVLLHSLSHALLRRVSVECGYTAASIRERIYARTADSDGPAMAGLLLYTAAPDSEGTLGGLVRLGEPEHLGRLLKGCLHEAEMCASDPLCAEHDPSSDGHGLHSAACHTCLFLPETCCERGNRYLDRAALVQVFGSEAGGFFSSEA